MAGRPVVLVPMFHGAALGQRGSPAACLFASLRGQSDRGPSGQMGQPRWMEKRRAEQAPVRPTIHSWARALRGDGAPMVQGHTAVGGGSGDAHTTSCRLDRVALGHGQPRMQTMDPFRRRPAHEGAVARPTNHTQHRRAHILRGTFVHPTLARQPSEEGPFVHPPLARQPSTGTPVTLSHIKQ